MRLLAILAFTVPVAVGCARQSVTPAPVEQAGEQLEVRLYPATAGSEMKYFVSEPAFITLFEVAPDGRARLIYPYYREKPARSVAGLNTLRPRGEVPPLFYASAPRYSGVRASEPTYLYLIASRSPLPLPVIERSLRIVPQSFSSADISQRLGVLESLAVGHLSDDNWSSALLPVWPNVSIAMPHVPNVSTRAGRP